ncbi:hypothetical protein MNBD_CPR01-13 [hydrothermal vent metagenome]|uniref:Phospholipase D-like domain-containing protein n=1 Tax=hydrothermal vent metagenome TaxID=652676 RepID=A0A3B0V2Q1_9ZZZZ
MKTASLKTALVVIVASVVFGITGYALGVETHPARGATAPRADIHSAKYSTHILYSLDKKKNDLALISLIDNSKKYVYFAIYEFTLNDVADALVRAKERGVDVRGIIDRENSKTSYEKGVIEKLESAGIPLETQTHTAGIMHIKALVTENAYASGSYNWTSSATNVNDEVLEIGNTPTMHASYLAIIKKVLSENAGGAIGKNTHSSHTSKSSSIGTINYTDASKYIGKTASVSGIVINVYTAPSGTTFFDYCVGYSGCPFSAVIFADDKDAFGKLTRFQGRQIIVTGKISSYKGRAEIILNDPNQIKIK